MSKDNAILEVLRISDIMDALPDERASLILFLGILQEDIIVKNRLTIYEVEQAFERHIETRGEGEV